MHPYGTAGHATGVSAYEIGPDFIKVEFRNGDIYLYDYAIPGFQHVEQMKVLAQSGRHAEPA